MYKNNKKLKQFIGNIINSRFTVIPPEIHFIAHTHKKKRFTAPPMKC